MPIFYSAVARGKIVLCDHAEVSGNFESLCQSLLQTKTEEGSRLSYNRDKYLFHVANISYLTYLCVTEKTFDRNVAYRFLGQVSEELRRSGLREKAQVCGPFAMRIDFSTKLAELMCNNSSADRITALSAQVADVKQVTAQNIEKLVARGEALTDLEERSELLENSSVQFRKRATQLRRNVMLKNFKLWAVVIFILLLVLAIVVTLVVLAAMGKFDKK